MTGDDRITTQTGPDAQLLRPPAVRNCVLLVLLQGWCVPSGSAWLRDWQLAAQGMAVWNSQMAVWNLCCAGEVQAIVSLLAEWLRESQHRGAGDSLVLFMALTFCIVSADLCAPNTSPLL